MRVIVCGGRDYDDRAAIYAALDQLLVKATAEPEGVLVIIQGGCKPGRTSGRGRLPPCDTVAI